MIRITIGLKGIGKTKKLIDEANAAVHSEKGDVVCITNGSRLIHDIDREIRLINTESFDIKSFDMFEGFICGIISENYDITHIFMDSVFKIVPGGNMADLDRFLTALENIERQFGVSFTIMVTAELAEATDNVKKYIA